MTNTDSMRVLVIGGAGYIGAHVVHELLDQGHRVTIFDNLSSGCLSNVPESVHFVEADLLNVGALERLLSQASFDAVIHLAALKAAGDSMTQPERYGEHNIWGAMRLLHACSEAGIQKLVFSSSAAVYGDPHYLPVDEEHPRQPTNFYGYTKLAIERHLQWFEQLKGLQFVSLRYFNAAGYDSAGRVPGLERDPRNLIPLILEVAKQWRPQLAIFGDDYDTPDGTCVRDYIHVTDLAIAHAQALTHLKNGGTSLVVNLGSGEGHTVLQVLEKAREICQTPIPASIAARRLGDPPSLVASSDRAKSILGWQAQHSQLDNILKTAWAVYAKTESKPTSAS